MTFCMLTIATPEVSDVSSITLPLSAEYCARHGYSRSVAGRLSGRPPSWSKILLLLCEMADFDYLWVADADCLITNPDLRLEDIVSLAPNADLLIAKDRNGINAGSMIVKNTIASARFFQRVWDHGHVPELPATWWEQAAMMKLLQADHGLEVFNPPKRSINSYPDDWQPGDFVLHTPGIHPSLRPLLMRQHLSFLQESP